MIETEREMDGELIPSSLERLIRDVGALLLNADTVQHRLLRNDLDAAILYRVVLTGSGVFAYFTHAASRLATGSTIGGEVLIEVDGLDAPAGSLISVRDGHVEYV